MITKELVEQWAMDNSIAASNAFRASTHDLDCIYKAWPEELQAFAQRAADYAVEQREKELMAVGTGPVAFVDVVDTYEGPYKFDGLELLAKGKHHLHTAEQLAASRLQGERSRDEEVERHIQEVDASRDRIDDLERVNQGLLDAVDNVLEKAPCDCSHKRRYEDGEHLSGCHLFDLNIARTAIAAASQEKSNG